MAVVRESELWPIHSARRLHDQAQQGFLWQFFIADGAPRPNEDLMMLAQSCSVPGIEFTPQPYSVGGQEHYYLKGSKRGGQVTARFLEVEGGKVDKFFRVWAALTDMPQPEILKVTRSRRPKGFGLGLSGISRTGMVRLITRDGKVGVELILHRLQLVKFGGYELSYEQSAPLIVQASMVCDDVVRMV